MNFLEQLISEWYQYKGYFVRQNVNVGKRLKGGYDCELDIVAFDSRTNHLIHIEPSTDTDSWPTREQRYKKKFDLGRKYIPELFQGMKLPDSIEQRAVFLYGSKNHATIGGGKVYLVADVLREIYDVLRSKKINSGIVPENFSLIRTLHIFIDQYDKITRTDSTDLRGEMIRVQINGKIFEDTSARLLLEKILQYLVDSNLINKITLPWGTGRARFIISNQYPPVHKGGKLFFNAVTYKGYSIETHNRRDQALRLVKDVCKKLGIEFEQFES